MLIKNYAGCGGRIARVHGDNSAGKPMFAKERAVEIIAIESSVAHEGGVV